MSATSAYHGRAQSRVIGEFIFQMRSQTVYEAAVPLQCGGSNCGHVIAVGETFTRTGSPVRPTCSTCFPIDPSRIKSVQ